MIRVYACLFAAIPMTRFKTAREASAALRAASFKPAIEGGACDHSPLGDEWREITILAPLGAIKVESATLR